MRYNKTAVIFAIITSLLLIISIFLLASNSNANKNANNMAAIADQLTALSGLKGRLNDIHIHADFRAVMNGNPVDFKKEAYEERNAFAHLHFDNPEEGDKVMHIEANGINLGHFFNTLGMKFTSNCFITEDKSYCSENGKELMLFVNGTRNFELDNYEPKNNDRILIIYGSYSNKEMKEQISSVSEYSKRYG